MKHGLMSPGDLEQSIPDAAYEAGEQAARAHMAGYLAYGVASEVIHEAVPLALAHELRQMVAELVALQVEMCQTDGSRLRSAGLGEAIRHLRVRADRYDGGV